MNTTLIATLNKHYIYFVKTAQVPFYIAVPFKDFNQTNICIELYRDYEKLDVNKNDLVWITDEVIRIYKEIDNDNISLVIPIFPDNLINQTEQINDSNIFNALDIQISGIINSAYQTLNSNNLKVDSKIIIINNNQFVNFTNWFLSRYASRVDYKTYFDLKNIASNSSVGPNINIPNNMVNINNNQNPSINVNGNFNAGASMPNNNIVNPNPINNNISEVNPNMNFVTGNPNMVIDKNEVNETRANEFVPSSEQLEVPKANGSSGYVSYLLLGIVTAVISFVVLYLIF